MRAVVPPEKYRTYLITKQSAAKSQLETAILLWFNEGDPVSIHTLAVAAHECYAVLYLKIKRKPSELKDWLAKKPKGRQQRVRLPQNFFKHAVNDPLDKKVQLNTIDSDVLMLDAVMCHEALGYGPTALMRVFGTRFVYEHPATAAEAILPEFLKSAEVHKLGDWSRNEFLEKLYPIFIARFPV
jgi:hypothetical protein